MYIEGMTDDTKRDDIYLGPSLGEGKHIMVRDQDGDVSVSVISPEPAEGCSELHLSHVSDNHYKVLSERSGPAQVNTQAYQEGWSNIFGKTVVGQA